MLTNYNFTLVSIIQDLLRRAARYKPAEGLVHAIDGVRIDVQVLGSSVVLRNVKVIGDAEQLTIGQRVALRWENDVPIALATTNTGLLPISIVIQADNDTLENSPYGIRVRAGGIRPWHLSFVPSIEGHTHKDIFQLHGWSVMEDGTIFQNGTYIHPDGIISLGEGGNVIKLDSRHFKYRMWAGAVLPEDATFKVTGDGKVIATAGEIAGWDILADKLSKNDTELRASGELWLGSGDDVAVLSAVNASDWRLWIGDAVPANAPFRVNKWGQCWLDSATVAMTLQSDNYVAGLKGWKLYDNGLAEFENIIARGRIEATVFAEAAASTVAGQLIISIGGVLVSDVGTGDTDITLDSDILNVDDIVHFKASSSRIEWMRILSAADPVEGGFEYQVERDLQEEGACLLYAGEICVQKGSGVVERDTQPLAAGEEGGEFDRYQPGGSGAASGGGWLVCDGQSPYFGVNARFGPLWHQFSRVVQLGNLVGCPLDEYQTETWGCFIGDVNNYFVYDQANGLRIKCVGGGIDTNIDKDGIITESMRLAKVTDAPSYADGEARFWFVNDAGVLKIKIRAKDGAVETEMLVGTGDMLKSVYDTDSDGVVDNAEKVNNIEASTTAEANKLLALNVSSKLPASITGDADTVDGKHASDFTDILETQVFT